MLRAVLRAKARVELGAQLGAQALVVVAAQLDDGDDALSERGDGVMEIVAVAAIGVALGILVGAAQVARVVVRELLRNRL